MLPPLIELVYMDVWGGPTRHAVTVKKSDFWANYFGNKLWQKTATNQPVRWVNANTKKTTAKQQ